jgi:hypothetical protein
MTCYSTVPIIGYLLTRHRARKKVLFSVLLLKFYIISYLLFHPIAIRNSGRGKIKDKDHQLEISKLGFFHLTLMKCPV